MGCAGWSARDEAQTKREIAGPARLDRPKLVILKSVTVGKGAIVGVDSVVLTYISPGAASPASPPPANH
jgi:hypothetical protein